MGIDNQKELFSMQEIQNLLEKDGYYLGTLIEFTGCHSFLSHRDFWNYLDNFDIYNLGNKHYCDDFIFLFGEPLLLIDITELPPPFISEKKSENGFFIRFMFKNQLFSTSCFERSFVGLDVVKRIFNLFSKEYLFPEEVM